MNAADPTSIRERCRREGIERYAIYNRLRQGMTVEQAFDSALKGAGTENPNYMAERRETAELMRRWARVRR